MHQVCTSYLSISELLIHVLGNATFFLFKHEKCKNKQTKTPKKPHQKKKRKKKNQENWQNSKQRVLGLFQLQIKCLPEIF